MAGENSTPPLPTDANGAFASDQASSAVWTAEKELKDGLNWSKSEAENIAGHLKSLWDKTNIAEESVSLLISGLAWICRVTLEWELGFDETVLNLEQQVLEKVMPLARDHGARMIELMLLNLKEAFRDSPTSDLNFGGGEIGAAAVGVFNTLANRFNLLGNGANPAERGSGLKNQQYLVSEIAGLSTYEWFLDWASQHVGLGSIKDLQPFRNIMDEVVNVRNVVRQANNAGYAMMLHAPLTRDLNRAYPVKNIGLNALARLYVRGAMTQADYLDKCLDSGLDSTNALQLVLESAKLFSPSEIGKLVTHGLLEEADALTYLQHTGYREGDALVALHAETHARYWSIQERVGNAAVSAWKIGRITKDRLEEILQQCGFTADEITLLEVEQEFAKEHASKDLTYAQIKSLYVDEIIDVDAVIAFLDAQGYSITDRNRLVLLDFTKKEERQQRLAKLQARDRIQADTLRNQAAADEQKQQTELANARRALATVVAAEADALGQLPQLPAAARL